MGQVTVRIYGENYPLRTSDPAEHLEELARYVDTRMREVAASGKVVVTSKIAVLAALHIADELFRLRRSTQSSGADDGIEQRIMAITEALERALAPPIG